MSVFPQSMTGIGKAQGQSSIYKISVEVKSVNGRFLESRVKLPSRFSLLEIEIKNKLKKIFRRGSIDLYINLSKDQSISQDFGIDFKKVKTFLEEIGSTLVLSGYAESIKVVPTDFLRPEFALGLEDSKESEHLSFEILKVVDLALEDLLSFRIREGGELIQIIATLLSSYKEVYAKVLLLKDVSKESAREKLKAKLIDSKMDCDEMRFHQEVVFYLERMDVEEELSRIEIHLKRFEELLKKEKELGKEMDFLLQELVRETNTLGSKTASDVVSGFVIEMKLLLDKMKEQSLNLE